MSHLTKEEIAALQESGLHRNSPYLVAGVSHSMFSVIRHYGGGTISGYRYVYDPASDEAIRCDVVKWLAKFRKVENKKAVAENLGKQQEMTNW